MALTTRELLMLEDHLNMGQAMNAHLSLCTQQCRDEQLKSLCQQIAQKQQRHFQTLLRHLG